jgi:hypothetical protein
MKSPKTPLPSESLIINDKYQASCKGVVPGSRASPKVLPKDQHESRVSRDSPGTP